MTIALKIGSEDSQVQGFIYLDAVTRYSHSLSGKVTSFPVDSGANISDHFIVNNPKFTLEGVVSDVDVTGMSDKVKVDDRKPVNSKQQPQTPSIAAQSTALQYLPSAVKQFLSRGTPVVSADLAGQTTIPAVEMLFTELMRGTYYNSADNKWRNKMTPTVLYEMNGTAFANAHTDLVITDVSFDEDADSGDALRMSISLEKVRFVVIEQTDMPKLAKSGVKKKVAKTDKKGTPSCPTGKQDGINSAGDTAQAPKSISGSFSAALADSKAARR